jgi:hypothetical protein
MLALRGRPAPVWQGQNLDNPDRITQRKHQHITGLYRLRGPFHPVAVKAHQWPWHQFLRELRVLAEDAGTTGACRSAWPDPR